MIHPLSGTYTEPAYAKLNLFLHILGCDHKGYHLLESVAIFLPLQDKVQVHIQDSPSSCIDVQVKGDFPVQDTLCVKALQMLNWNVQVRIYKSIPVGGGLGGGSADVGAVLRLAKQVIHQELSTQQMLQIGADVPMCYVSKPLFVRSSIGGDIHLIDVSLNVWGILIKPQENFSTQNIFQAYDRLKNKTQHTSLSLQQIQAHHFLTFLQEDTDNDLMDVVWDIYPHIKFIKPALSATQPLLYRMTGSGSVFFALYANKTLADHALITLQKQYPYLWMYGSFYIP